MNSVSSRQFERKEKKKRKLAALANMVQLNDQDRLNMAKGERGSSEEGPKTSAAGAQSPDEEGFVKVSYKNKSWKKARTQEDLSCNSNTLKPSNTVQSNDNDHLNMAKGEQRGALVEGSQISESSEDNKSWKRTSHMGEDKSVSTNAEEEPSTKRSKQGTKEEEMIMSDSTDKSITQIFEDAPRAMTTEQYTELRRKLRERKRQIDDVPHLQLRELGQRALLKQPQDQRTPLFLTDIQHLLMTALIGKNSPCLPDRWCLLQKTSKLSHSVVLIVEGMSLYHYLSHESKFKETNKIFETRLEVMLPPRKDGIIMSEMAQIPLTNLQAKELIEKYGSLELAVTMNKDPTLLVQSMFPIEKDKNDVENSNNDNAKLPNSDKFPRTKLLLSALQMVDEGYPMPLGGELKNRFSNYIFTKDKYDPVTDSSPMYGVDCEMCKTSSGANELTRISIVNEQMETVYESLVRPDNKIVDYLTHFSGITPEIMKTVTKNRREVQREVSELLPSDAILVGQSLNFDLHAMRMMHPYVIDTSVCFNLTGIRKRKSKLQQLAMTFLKESIQENVDGHDSVEDSAASLKLVQMKLANSLEFGDVILSEKRRLQQMLHSGGGGGGADDAPIKNNLFAYATKRDKRTAIITAGKLEMKTKDIIKKADEATEVIGDKLKSVNLYEVDSNKKAMKKTREIALENALTITNLQINEENITLDTIDSTVGKLDKWINKLWKTVAHNGLFLVLMGGSNECPSGVAKIAIKKNIANVVNEVPLNVQTF